MVLFALSTVAAIYSPTIEFFNACRFVQGIGGAGGIVLSRSVSTDCYSGRELAKTLAIIGAVNGIAPVTAPVVGGLVAGAVGWQGIFWILFGIGAVLLAMCLVFRESLPADRRHRGSVVSLLSAFPRLLRMRRFVVCVLLFGFASGVLFGYISSASFIIQNHYGFSELIFAIVFGVNATAIGIGSALALKFRDMHSAAVSGAAAVLVLSALQLVGYRLSGSFGCFEALIFFTLMGVGLIFTSSTTLAMDAGRRYVGSASAIVGATGFLFGGIVSPLVGLGDILPTTLTILAVNALGAMLFVLLLRRSAAAAPAEVSNAAR